MQNMDVLCASKKIIQNCSQSEEKIIFTRIRNKENVENALQQKIRILEFHVKELILEKDRLLGDVAVISSIINRTEQTLKSLQYPRDTNLKCNEIRSAVPELLDDSVQNELFKEIKLLEKTETFLSNLLKELQEQLRKHRSTVFYLEKDLQKKMTTLKSEKQNDTVKIAADFETRSENITFVDKNKWNSLAQEISENWQNVEWILSTQKLLNQGKRELENAQKLIYFAEESISSKTSALITQYNCTNESFHKRIAQCKQVKSNLEMELLNINELIHCVRKCIDETHNTIASNELEERALKMRLRERIISNNPELVKDIVQLTLSKNLLRQSEVVETLRKNFKMAHLSITSLMKIKNQHEVEIQKKTKAIKIDEVECLPARSSIHYHAY